MSEAPTPEASTALDSDQSPLSSADRARVLSAVRLKLTLTVFVVTILLAFAGTAYYGVSRIFDWLTPSIRLDLERKAQRGSLELAQSAQLGMVVGDSAAIAKAASDYVSDRDVVALRVFTDDGKSLFEHGAHAIDAQRLFAGTSGTVHDLGAVYAAWAPSELEGVKVGRVVLAVSKARLQAGMELRREILSASAIVCALALVLCLLFVNLYIGPILRVTGEAFVRLETATEAALQATRLKSQFLANMSHEIRTPMNGIVGVLDLLHRTVLSPKQQRYTQTIENSARSLLTIIDDILDFSKLEAGKYVFRESPFELRQVTQDVVELLAPRAHAKGVEIVQRIDGDVPYSIMGDVDRVKQVITNLVGNAVKFTEQGHVLLRASVDARTGDRLRLRFSVADTGLGIAAEDQSKLFGVFSQVDGSMTRRHGGTGLGLAICKRLAEAMGGSIGVQSEVGKGSTFWFTIDARDGALREPEGLVPRDARILVVAKDDAQRETMCELVTRWGMRFAATDTAEHAVSLITEAEPRFDVAVADGCFDESTEASRTLFDLCAAEALPLIRLLSTAQAAPDADPLRTQLCLTKPVRVSELYNGLLSLMDGESLVTIKQRRRKRVSDPGQLLPGARAKVLVVDDNEINRVVAVELLTELGYPSDVACDGREALEKAARGGYGAILMDCQMPEMDGYQATAEIRKLAGLAAKVPIIALTAHAMAGDRERVLAAGMDDYTAKPVRVRALERVLGRWVTESTVAKVVSIRPTAAEAAPSRPAQSAAPSVTVPTPVSLAPVSLAPVSLAPVSLAPEAETSVIELDPTVPRSTRVIELFLLSVPEQIAALASAAAQGDAPRVKQLAHKLKGGSLSLGVLQLAEACSAVERGASSGHIETDWLAQIAPRFESASRLLAQASSKRPSPASPASSASPASPGSSASPTSSVSSASPSTRSGT